MKKLSLKFTGIKEALKKEEMKQIKGGGSQYECYNACQGSSGCWSGSCQQVSCTLGGLPYNNCV